MEENNIWKEYKDKADQYFNDNNFSEAINNYTLGLQNENEIDDNKFKIYMNRCLAYYKISEFELALDDAIDATKINTNSGKAWSRVGSCLLSLKKYYPCLSAFEKAIELEEDNDFYKKLYENACNILKENNLLINNAEDEDTEDEEDKNTEDEEDKNTEKHENTGDKTIDIDIMNLTNKLKNLKNTEGLAEILKDNDLNMPGDFVSEIFKSMLNNETLMNKLSQKEFQEKIIDYQKNPFAVFNDKEMMDLMNNIINTSKY